MESSKWKQIVKIILTLIFFILKVQSQGWVAQTSGTTKNLRGVCFTDALHGIVVGDAGTILKTTNGGLKWEYRLSGVVQNLKGISFGDWRNGVVVGDSGIILRTSDGGDNWINQSSGHVCAFTNVIFRDPQTAIVVGDSGLILRSTDWGATWFSQTSGTKFKLNAVSFNDPNVGIAVGDSGTVVRTFNGGIEWIKRSSITWRPLNDVSFINNVAFTITDYSVWYKSLDSGSSWFNYGSGAYANGYIKGISCIDQNRATIVGSIIINQTSNGGNGWKAIYTRLSLQSISTIEGVIQTAVGNNGAIIRTYDSRWAPPPVSAIFPEDNATNIPFGVMETALSSIKIKWRRYAYSVNTTAHYRIQVGTDPMFLTNVLVDITRDPNISDISDTSYIVSLVGPLTKYYWRICIISHSPEEPGWSMWSPIWNFTTGDYNRTTIKRIQEIAYDSLLVADSLQNMFPARASLQLSPMLDSIVLITAKCIYPPKLFVGGPYRMIVCDTANGKYSWNGITVKWYQSDSLRFADIERGQILWIYGKVAEEPTSDMNSNTVFKSIGFKVIGYDTTSLPPIPVKVSDFFGGSPEQQTSKYSAGEQYEGSLVEFHDLTVSSILEQTAGTFNLSDANGNTIATSDISRMFTLRNHRSPFSTFSTPQVGTHVDKIRGVLISIDGPEAVGSVFGYRITPVNDGDIVFGAKRNGIIRGSIFNDENKDSVWNGSETGIANRYVTVSGKVSVALLTNANGDFSISGLDSGWYAVKLYSVAGWGGTKHATYGYRFYLGVDELKDSCIFGAYRQWCTVEGNVFYDNNENGIKDYSERNVPNCTLELNGSENFLTATDLSGHYIFPNLEQGRYTLSLHAPDGFEQMFPRYHRGYDFYFTENDQHSSNNRFGLRRIPTRIKLKVLVHDNNSMQKELEWGIRPGASYGIWSVDPNCTGYDYSEGEVEIPPRIIGYFDARLIDSRKTTGYFGLGTFTDMRDFTSASQTDTFKVSFYPGYFLGGNYPMTIHWSSTDVKNSFMSCVFIDKNGVKYNMFTADSLVINNTETTYLLIVTQQPNIPSRFLRTWQMISIPERAADPRIWPVCRPADLTGFDYTSKKGYTSVDSLQPGTGYWVKSIGTIDTTVLTGPKRFLDTINVTTGWNLIGGISSPVPIGTIETIPSEMTLDGFFKYDAGYFSDDTIHPYKAYWIKANMDGKFILKNGGALFKNNSVVQANDIFVQDIAGCKVKLSFYYSDKSDINQIRSVDMPPKPPEDAFDVRFGSDKAVEVIHAGDVVELPISISSATYPVKIFCNLNQSNCNAMLKVNDRILNLNNNNVIEIEDSQARISLVVGSRFEIPKAFELHQNYPNPFNPVTTIKYTLPYLSRVTLCIYNILGQKVAELVNGVESAGNKYIEWNASNLSSGVYYYRIEAASVMNPRKSFMQVKKMLLVM